MEARKPIGVVLAGGRGRRLGRTKGDLPFGGRPLAARAADTLAPLCRGVVVSVGVGGENPAPGRPAVEDRPPAGRGPLAGIDAVFRVTGKTDLLVLACDYPRVETSLLESLLCAATSAADLVLPCDRAGNEHPLVALWRRHCAIRVRDSLARGVHRVLDLLPDLRVQRLDAHAFGGVDLERALANLNRPEDLEALGRCGPRS